MSQTELLDRVRSVDPATVTREDYERALRRHSAERPDNAYISFDELSAARSRNPDNLLLSLRQSVHWEVEYDFFSGLFYRYRPLAGIQKPFRERHEQAVAESHQRHPERYYFSYDEMERAHRLINAGERIYNGITFDWLRREYGESVGHEWGVGFYRLRTPSDPPAPRL